MNITGEQIARMIDISAVKADSRLDEVESIVKAAKEYHFICVYTLPSLAPYAKHFLMDDREVSLGGAVGFPSGGSSTATKTFEAEELLRLGCRELDMVINIGKLKSQLYQDVAADIHAVVAAAGEIPVKVILEVSLLSTPEICDGAKIIRDSGAQYVKTGTGWFGATTLEHVQLIRDAVGDSIRLKVAGGVRNLDTLLKMYAMGASRFGIGHVSAINIMKEYNQKARG